MGLIAYFLKYCPETHTYPTAKFHIKGAKFDDIKTKFLYGPQKKEISNWEICS